MVGFTSVSPGKPLPKIREETLPDYLFERASYFTQLGRTVFLEDGLTGEQRTFKDFESQTLQIASCFYKRGLRKGDIVVYMTSRQIHQVMMMMGVWRANGVVRSLYIDESEGAWHSHRAIVTDIRHWANFPFMEHKPNLLASKGTHVSGAVLPLAILAKGVMGVVLSKVSKEILIQAVDKYKPGMVFAFPSFLLSLGSSDAEGYDVTSVETILTGGSPITAEITKAFLAIGNVKTVLIAFGLTEAPCVATNADLREGRTQDSYVDSPATTVGRPYPGGELQIRDLDTMEVLGPNQRGEVVTRGDFLFQGYYKNPESTMNAFIDGWFKTGDVGYLDDNGYLFIVDRAKDIFKYFHNHISPTELEAVIGTHPAVKEVCVCPIPDEGGEVPRAFVTLMNPNNDKPLAQLATEIKNFADGKLATYKQLKGGLYIVDDFPKGKTGKVVRTMVGQMPLPSY